MNKNDKQRALVPRLRFPEYSGRTAWKVDRLGDLCRLYQSETISSSAFVADGPHLVYSANGVIGRLDRFNHPEEEVIIGCRGLCGGAFMTEPQSWINGNAMVIAPKGAGISKRFLFYALLASDLTPTISGSAQPQITRQGLAPFKIAIPSSLEQHKIAECLGSLDDLIGAEGRKLAALRKHKKGLIQQLFPCEGETRPRIRFPEFWDAGEWKWGRCRDIATVLQGYGFPEKYQGEATGDYPFYKVSDISLAVERGRQYISDANNYIDDQILTEIRAKPVPVGTIIFAKIGEAIRSNRRVVTTKPAVIDNNVAGLKAIEGKTSDDFLFYLWSNVSLIDHAGGVVPAVSKIALENVPLTYPSRPEEQQRIADCLAALDATISAQAKKLDALHAHKGGLMQQLFPAPEDHQ